MKKALCLLFVLLLTLSLCACEEEFEAPPPDAMSIATPEDGGAAPPPAPEAADDLTPVLTEIRERVHPGTAGSSLTAAQLACRLLDWSIQTGMEEAQIKAVTAVFCEPMDEDARAEFAWQLSCVSGAAELVRSEEGLGLLEDVGGTDGTLFPWTDAPLEKLEFVYDAAQMRELDPSKDF
ncbi:MAG: hypothetical protein K6G17_02235 [Oscillospiraceae bacterium]|nr:hypothetical protein [Oscillospiraceae bacterium]